MARRCFVAWIPAAVAVVWVAGCAKAPDAGPPTVHFGQDVCAKCNMIVSEARFASAVIAPVDGRLEPSVFDDIGCLFAWEQEFPDAAVARWMRDSRGTEWVSAESAWYVRSVEIRSPMGSGIAACATREAAEELATSRNGKTFDWTGLRELARKESLLSPPKAAGTR